MAPVVAILTAIGSAVTFGAVVGTAAAVIGGALIVAGTVAAVRMGLFEIEMPKIDTDRSRQATVKSTTEPYKIIYGQTLVSGPVAFVGTAGTDNKDLYYAIALAGHEVNDITDMHFDDVVISDADIGGGSSSGGNVTGSGIFGPKNSKTIVKINKFLGTSTQAADSDLVAAFTGWTSAHQGKGIAYIVTKWTLDEDSQETWDKYTPQNIKALVQGKKLYDPRLEFAAVSTYGQDITNVSYIAYGDNPALCLVDYLINSDYGMGISASKIDWDAVVTAADGCDVSVAIPNSATEKRFTCNGVLFGTDSHRTNINKILSSMNGNLSYVNGKYVMRAGIYEAPAISLNEDDLISGLSIKTSLERGDRFNTIKGVFIDPEQNYKSTEFPEVQLADALSRDNNEVLDKEIALNMTNSSYMAQRISNKLIQLSDQQKVVSFPANLSAMRVAVGDRVQVSIDELSWSNKVFQCLGWTFSEEGGINLTLREDSSTSYADPAAGDYSTVSATGDIDPGFRGVPGPSGLSATAGLKNVELDWVNPPNNKDFESIFVYASPNGNFSSAVKIGETDGTQFVHDFANGQDAVSPGDTRYYWVRAIRYVGTSDEARSILEPNSDPNTTVFAEVGRVEWSDVSGSTDAPEDNATVGATLGVDFYDIDDTTVLSDSGIRNQTVLNIESEDVIAGNFTTGVTYVITSIGTTDFTLIGASANTVGLVFTATGAGSGTGTASDRSLITNESNVGLETQTSGDVGLYTYTEVTSLGAQYSIKIDNAGRVAGFGLSSTLPTDTNDPAFSEFTVLADKFQIVDPASPSNDPFIPFVVTADKIEMNTDVRISGDLVTLGTISAERLQIDNITLDTDGSGNLIIKNDGVTSLQIAASAVGNTQLAGDAVSKDKFQSDVNPVELGATLPATATQGDIFFLTTDNNVYRYDGTSWTKAITLTEVSDAGTLAGLNDINLSYVTDAGALAALNDIDLSKVTDAGALAALSGIDLSYVSDAGDLAGLSVITSDYIAANAVIAGKIAAGAVSANEIAANTITAGQIAANTITAAEIAANTITAGEIQAGAIGATEISVTNLAAISADLGTVTAGSLSATLISGDVTEKYAYSYSDAVTTLSGSATTLHDFVIPGPTGGISKRGLANITAEFSLSRAGGTGNDEVVIDCYLFRKSKGQSSILLGTVAAVSGSGSKRTIQISGDVTDQIGHYGACDSASDGSSIIDYRFIDSVWFDGNYTNIQLFRISGTDSWSVSDNVYYSADAFDTGTTTYYAFGRFSDSKYVIAGGDTQYMTIPIIGYFGKATDLTTLRLRAEISSGATNSTVTFYKTQGVLENTR
jgi:hypothetical protein